MKLWKVFVAALCVTTVSALADNDLPEQRLKIDGKMVVNESDTGDPKGIVDEQDQIIGPPAGNPSKQWEFNWAHAKKFPLSAHIDLGAEKNISKLWLYDIHAEGELKIEIGKPGAWKLVTSYGCREYMKWVPIAIDARTRYIRLTRMEPGANFSEIAIYEYTPKAYEEMLARKAAEAKAAADREAALAKAREEMARRPLVDAGPVFGKLYLIEEIDCAKQAPDSQSPADASRVEQILGKPFRVLNSTPKQSSSITYRIGKMKLLQPGMAYVLEVEYPEDKPRSWIVMNGGNETARGFHTGPTLGDAMQTKYVNSLHESTNTPLSGKVEHWRMLFNLHDRTPDTKFIRGRGVRELTAEDGFTVTIGQFAEKHIPLSHGAAVSKIRLLGVPDASKFDAKYTLPPKELPHRALFWREEMSDGVIDSSKDEERGVTDLIQWWAYKRNTMKFLGMNTFTKDLLEFGACQHWDPTDGGGNEWVYFNDFHKGNWEKIVAMMGEAGFDVLPYYEYSGSKGQRGLGEQKRSKPLARDDAYTHIPWVESHNVDITDPDAYTDFKKMLDLTVIKFKDKARFTGIWIRPRMQIPVSFADATRERFATEANGGQAVTREQLKSDQALYDKYIAWWQGKRREFLVAMRDHLRQAGVNERALVLYTAHPGEPGVPFRSWDIYVPNDDPAAWASVADDPRYGLPDGKKILPISISDVVNKNMYLEGLLAPGLNWGNWEFQHATPAADPQNYKDVDGVLMTHAINRLYTVSDPRTFDAFRGPSGLAVVRHYTLNEHMMYDANDKPHLGYFVADVEKAGPYCMMAEAVAMANGDPTHIGYLVGGNFARGFPEYARNFNTAFLSLPALPSKVIKASSSPEVVVREITTASHGTYYAVVHVGMKPKSAVKLTLPAKGAVTNAATGEPVKAVGGTVTLSMYPYQLIALHVK